MQRKIKQEDREGFFEESKDMFVIEARTKMKGLKKNIELTLYTYGDQNEEDQNEKRGYKKAWIELPTIALSDDELEHRFIEDAMLSIELDKEGTVLFR